MAVQPERLRFYALPHAMVQDFERLDAGIKKFLGWKHVQKAPPADPTNPEDPGQWAFDFTGELAEVPNQAEYRKACKEGSLVPADAETAQACNVEFKHPVPALEPHAALDEAAAAIEPTYSAT